MSDQPLPATIRAWMQSQDWGTHHARWHAERQWDRLSPAVRARLIAQGWSRAAHQEGSANNGLDFLFIHRAMIQILKGQFSSNASLFLGWSTPPTDPSDVSNPVPVTSPSPGAFRSSMLSAINRLTANMASFASEDELGLYIQTNFRPTPSNPFSQSSDSSTGIHNYIHNRFSDRASSINMGDPSVNIENAQFWKLHGWIDSAWSRYRTLKGKSDAAQDYVASLQAEKVSMLHIGGHHHALSSLAIEADVAARRVERAAFPSELRQPFEESTANRVQRLLASTPTITTKPELIDYLQTAIQVEHGTLPPYLTAMWSLKSVGSGQYTILKRIALQEMLHLGIVCNVLRSIGERPLISPPEANIPVFPGQMPGIDLSNVLTGDIALEPFSTFGMDRFNRINLFMRIEEPEGGDIDPRRRASLTAASALIPKFRTIGEFYDVIAQGIETLASSGAITFGGGNQVTSDYSAFSDLIEVSMKPDAIRLIRLIQQQGEGTGITQASGPGVNELAHYYAFKQIVEEKQYNWTTGSPILDAGLPLPFPTQDQVRQFTPAPVGGNSQSAAFDATYSQMLDSLQYAWDGHPESLDNDAVNSMSDMSSKAITLMDSGFGPNFFYVPTSVRAQARRAISIRSSEKVGAQSKTASVSASTKRNTSMQALATVIFEPADRQPIKFPQGAVNLLTFAVLIPGYARIREILDEAVNGTTFGAHGPFWRSLTRDQFIVKSVFGKPLIQKNPDGTFDPQESNIIKALEGRPPFGKNIVPPPAGAVINRMPDGFPAMPQAKIDEIRTWIQAGCPDIAPTSASIIDIASPASMSSNDYVRFWKSFDDVAMFQATSQVQDDIGNFFTATNSWFDFAHDPTKESAWATSIADIVTADSIRRLEQLQRQTVLQSFGTPSRQEDLLSCWEMFGDDSLPDDPLRPVDVRHTMNGESMWFFWSAFTDAALRLSSTDASIPVDFWVSVARCVLLGLMNDGVFRGRFPVQGFPKTSEGKTAMRSFALTLPAAQIASELRTRCVDAGF